MDVSKVATQLRRTLAENIDERVLLSEKRYFKEPVKTHGVRISQVTHISKQLYKSIENESKEDIFSLCEELWWSGYNEEGYMAGNLAYYIHNRYEPADFERFESWLANYVTNWATCDTLCNHALGTFVEMYPGYITYLKKWTTSDNRWMRRGAAVTLIIPARKGLFLDDIFEISEQLLQDKDDLVQKGYGWMLKAASESHLEEVYKYVLSRRGQMPRTAYRYAREKMPKEMRAEAMKKN